MSSNKLTPSPTPLRVSTMTVIGHFGVIPDRAKLFHSGAFIPYGDMKEGIIKIEVDAEAKGICTDDILHQTGKEKKKFFNQSSLVFRLQLDDAPTFKEVNIKIFKNGGFQMTGISSEEMARAALTRFIELNKGPERGIWATDPTIAKFDVCMMNSDYKINKVIRRDRLYRILVEEYGLWCSYEPTIYQGVNTKYFWNKTRPAAAPPGICVCPEQCEGGGDGYSVGNCKKITISPFRTGNIIITGAKKTEQLMDAYQFMNGILTEYAEDVLRDDVEATAAEPVQKKKSVAAPTTTEGILKQKMRSSPRNIVTRTI
jgi:TATA-box binding protein (TBP) (component of TFIID and TFIIIB)